MAFSLLPAQDEPEPDAAARRPVAVLALGFRSFFLVAPAFAAVAIAAWLLSLSGIWVPGTAAFAPTMWHAHEMLFGYSLAVVAGFLFTAARNWTGRDTPTGGRLLVVLCAWALGRAVMTGLVPLPNWAVGAAAMVFPVLLWTGVASVILPARSTRNYGVLLLLGVLLALQAASHVAGAGQHAAMQRGALFGALHLLVVLNVVIGGRVIPMFTQNGLMASGLGGLHPSHGVGQLGHRISMVAISASVVTALLATIDAAGVQAARWPLAVFAAIAAAAHLARMRTWSTSRAMRVPMLAVLHLGYVWIVIAYALVGYFAANGYATAPAPTHALSLGVVGTMTVGMMARVSLGHTGRSIKASPRIIASFVAMAFAAIVRVGGALFLPGSAIVTRTVPGVLFVLAGLLLLAALLPLLTTPRPDGRPG